MSVIIPKDCFHQPQVADLRLIACPGAEELTNLIDKHLVRWAAEAGYQTNSFIIESACPRFQSGDAKGLVKESVRGDDIFIVVDPGNYTAVLSRTVRLLLSAEKMGGRPFSPDTGGETAPPLCGSNP